MRVLKKDLSKYPKGIYILEVNSSGYKEQKKLIIQWLNMNNFIICVCNSS